VGYRVAEQSHAAEYQVAADEGAGYVAQQAASITQASYASMKASMVSALNSLCGDRRDGQVARQAACSRSRSSS